jgi:O-antigen/teichoic acid export membrane protein
MRGKPILRDLAVVAIGTTIANVASFLMSMAGARLLTPQEFGALGALLGLSIIGSTLAVAAQAVAARRLAAAESTGSDGIVGSVLRMNYAAAALLLLVGAGVSPPLSTLLKVSVLAVIATFASVAVLVVGFAVLGVIQGRSEHTRFGGAYAALGVARAAFTIGAVALHPTAEAAAVGMLVGSAIGSLFAVLIARVPLRAGARSRGVARELVRNAIALLGLYALTNVDVVLARAFLSPVQSGDYAVGALVAKIAFFLPTFILYVLFPHMASGRPGRARRAAVLATVAVGVFMTAASAILAPLFIWLAGGVQYAGLNSMLWLFALQGSVFALVQVLVYVRLSSEDRGAAVLMWTGLLAFGTVVTFWLHHSVNQIVLTSVLVSLAMALTSSRADFRLLRQRRPEDARR